MSQPVSQNPLGHVGVLAKNPPNLILFGRMPLATDINANIGDFGYDSSSSPPSFYQLTSLSYPTPGLAWWEPVSGINAGIRTINTILPAVGGNFTLTAGSGIVLTPGTNAITISLTGGGTAIDSFTVPSGTSPVIPNVSGNVDWPAGNGFAITGATNSMTGNMVSPFTGSFGFTSSVSGANEVISVSHTSNTANSNAIINVAVAGTSGGDAFIYFNVGSARSWSIGPDTSDSQIFKITTAAASSSTPSTGTNVFQIDASGILTGNSIGAQFFNYASNPGNSLAEVSFFNSNAGTSAALALHLTTAGESDRMLAFSTGSGDPAQDWLLGMNNSDNSFRICQATVVGGLTTNVALQISSAGLVTIPITVNSPNYQVNGIRFVDYANVATPSDGTYGIATCFAGNAISGILTLFWNSNANRVQSVTLLVDTQNFDFTASAITVLSNNSYLEQDVLTNFRIVSQNSDSSHWVLVDVGNRNGGTGPLTVMWQGNGNSKPSLNPGLPGANTATGFYGWKQATSGAMQYYSTSASTFAIDAVGNITLGTDNTNILSLNNSSVSTVGVAGGASPLPVTPSGYILVNINGSPFEIPYYARA